jgi:CubicO group peptidase (beta-lactamase class C family)
MKRVLLILSSFALMFVHSLSQQNLPVSLDREKITRTISLLADQYNIPDYSLVIVNKDSVLLSLDKNQEHAGKNYLIGSCSKSFTALGIMKLVDEGYVGLETPVKNYLPWFEMKNPDYTGKLTVRHLLNQQSGFERQHGFFDVKTDNANAFERALADYIKKIDVKSAPGKAFTYCNLNYVLLGLIIQHATGQPYHDYMMLHVMPQTGMTNTRFTRNDNYAHNLITPYQYSVCFKPMRSSNYYYSDFLLPAGYISSNTSDLGKYLQLMLAKTAPASDDSLLSPESYALLTGKGHTGYAMGWFSYMQDSMEVINHSGLDENFSSTLFFMPDIGLGGVLLCNINSLEFCGRVEQELKAMVTAKPAPVYPFSFEKIMRWGACLVPLLLLAGMVINFIRWNKYGFRMVFTSRIIPNIRLVIGVALSLLLVAGLARSYQMFIIQIIRYQPDIGWGLVLIAVFGTFSALMRYWGTALKYKEAEEATQDK